MAVGSHAVGYAVDRVMDKLWDEVGYKDVSAS